VERAQGNVTDASAPVQHQHGCQPAGMIFIVRFMDGSLHQASFVTGNGCCDRYRSVRLVILVGLAIDQIGQSGLSSLPVIYYFAKLFSFADWRQLLWPHPLSDGFKPCELLPSLSLSGNFLLI